MNMGRETKNIISIPMLQALDENSESNEDKDPDYKFFISYDFYGKDNNMYHRKGLYGYNEANRKSFTPQLNHISMKMTSFPLMSQTDYIIENDFCNSSTVTGCKNDYCSCTHVLQVKLNSIVELILVDEGNSRQ